MPDYKNAKIYKLVSDKTNDIYIGSTTQKLSERFRIHNKALVRWLEGKDNFVTSFVILSYDDCKIELIEKFPCETKKELYKREGEYIRELPCINKNIAGRSKQEWYEDNEEKITKYKKQWQEQNKEKIAKKRKEQYENNKDKMKEKQKKKYEKHKKKYLEKMKEKIECHCGSVIRKSDLARHKRSQKHKNNLEKLNENKK